MATIIAVTILTYAFSVSAVEFKSMIRYDRVWEHISVHWSDRQVYHVKFDGTEEINGKTYHRLVAFRKASFDYDSDNQPYLFDIDENYYESENDAPFYDMMGRRISRPAPCQLYIKGGKKLIAK